MVRLRTIGECAMQVGASHVGPEAERLFATLLVLATERGRRVSRARLIALIWPGVDERNGRHCLRQTIYKLRQLGAAVEVAGGYLELPAAEVEGGLDGLVTSAEFAADDVPVDAPFDEWLPGYAPTFSPALQEWVEKQRDYVHGQVRRAIVKAIIERRAQNRWSDVDALARRCLAFDPLNEEATLALAESAAMTGSKTTALRILDAYLAELGPRAGDIAMPAEVLRRRIAERLKQPRYVDPSEAYFVGRSAIMATFGAALQSARGGFGSAHLVWGPPGIGKSRLAEEVAKLAALQGFRMHRANCQSTDVGRPLSVFADAVPALRRLPGAAGVDPKSVKYLKRLSEYDDALADPPEDPYDSAVLFANVRRSIFDLFDAVTSECSLLLVVDDAHWLDAMSWGVLRELMEGARSHRLLVLCTSRTPHATPEPPAEPTRGLLVHRLDPLDGPACDELIAAVTRDAARGRPDARLHEWTLTVAEGNPLFVRALIGHWMNGYPEYTLPPSLEALIEERLNRLSPSALRALQACAVLGRNSTVARLEAILGYRTVELLDAVTELERLGLVVSTDDGIHVRHDVLRAHTLRRIGETELKLWHRYAGLELRKAAFAERSHDLLWASVEHLTLSGNATHAMEAVLAFADYLSSIGLIDDAATLLVEADRRLDLINSEDGRSMLLNTLRRAHRWKDLCLIEEAFRQRAQNAEFIDDRDVQAELIFLQAKWQTDCPPQGLIDQCLRLAEAPQISQRTRLQAALQGLMLADNACDRDRGIALFEAVRGLLSHDHLDQTIAARVRVVFHTAFGDRALIAIEAQRLVESAERGDERELADSLKVAAHAYRVAGLLDKARDHLLAFLAIMHGDQTTRSQLSAMCSLGDLEFDRGDREAAERWFSAADAAVTRLGNAEEIARVRHSRAVAYAKAGLFAEAIEYWTSPTLAAGAASVLRLCAETTGYKLFIANHSGASISTDELTEALTVHLLTVGFTGSDLLWYHLMTAFERIGDLERAMLVLDSVVGTGRRSASPLPLHMREHPLVKMRVGAEAERSTTDRL